MGGARAFFAYTVDITYRKDEIIAGMQLLRFPGAATVYTSAPPSAPLPAAQGSRLEWIQTHKLLRVGYMQDNLPFAYFNGKGDLVGFDVEMAHLLARDLEVELAFVPVMRDRIAEQINEGYCDIVMSGMVVTPERAQVVSFSAPYTDATLAFVVKDHRLEEFSSRDAIRAPQSAPHWGTQCAVLRRQSAPGSAAGNDGPVQFHQRVFRGQGRRYSMPFCT